MGWDIVAVTEYKKDDHWVIGNDYTITHSAFEDEFNRKVSYSIDNPVWEMRNYNLFRVLANIHNTKKHIDHEKSMYNEIKVTYHYSKLADLYPETNDVTDVVDYDFDYVPNDVDQVTKEILLQNTTCDPVIRVFTLQRLFEFAKNHNEYRQFDIFVDKCNEIYSKANQETIKRTGHALNKIDFRVIVMFTC